MSEWIPTELRDFVRQRAHGKCEYCLLHEDDAGLRHQPDHIVAIKHQGATVADNLAYSCAMCNSFKGSDLGSIDVVTGKLVRLFNPRVDVCTEHFQLVGVRIVPLSAEGRVTVTLLQFNRPDILKLRRLLIAARRYP